MSRTVATSAARRGAYDDRAGRTAVVHRPVFRDVIDDLVEAEPQEVAEHDLCDRAEPRQREPCRDPCDRGLAERRGPYARGEIRAQPACHLEGAPVGVEDVLTEQDHAGVGLECVAQRVAECA
jgi:hypothetical protein